MEQNNNTQKDIIVRIDPDLKEIVPDFIRNRHNDILKINEALKSSDYETIRILGHSMKGSGGGYGFDAISDIGAIIEIAAKNKTPKDIIHQLNTLSSYLRRVKIVYE
ncbi:MAG: Hpt domain-containing protein [Planctomycetes bacterium]|nr:Hpt domain-containing protein [Planctomycetota bacterium]